MQLREKLARIDGEIEQLRARIGGLADQRARLIAEEVARRGRGGVQQVAEELETSRVRISQILRRAREKRS
jgi:hypothetical protein